MELSKSHLYYIRKEKDRRARVLSAKICWDFGSPASTRYIKMIKRHMSLELNQRFGISRLEQMDDELFLDYLKAVHEYQFFYGGKSYQ